LLFDAVTGFSLAVKAALSVVFTTAGLVAAVFSAGTLAGATELVKAPAGLIASVGFCKAGASVKLASGCFCMVGLSETAATVSVGFCNGLE
jgi:hypothetical protein